MNEGVEVDTGSGDTNDLLMQWLVQRGAQIGPITIGNSAIPGAQRGLFATRPIPAGELLFAVPLTCGYISTTVCDGVSKLVHDAIQHQRNWNAHPYSKFLQETVYTLKEPYFPSSTCTSTSEDMDTSTATTTSTSTIFPTPSSQTEAECSRFVNGICSELGHPLIREYPLRWACRMWMTRAFVVDEMSASGQRIQFQVLLPLLDTFNYCPAPGYLHRHYISGDKWYCHAQRPYSTGEEILETYQPGKSSEFYEAIYGISSST